MKEQTIQFPRGVRSFTRLIALLSSIPLETAFQVTLAPLKKERSNLQNKALWGCAYETLRKLTGNDKDDLHEYFCGEYFGWEVKDVMGAKKKSPKRTTTTDYDGKRDVISTIHLSDFYSFIQQRSAENGYYVPDPDPMWWSHEQEQRRVA